MTRWLLPLLLAPTVLFAEPPDTIAPGRNQGDAFVWDDRTFIRLQPTNEPGAVAEVVFSNTENHARDERFFLQIEGMEGLEVEIIFDIVPTPPPDSITVIVPEGYIAIPERLEVAEGEEDKVLIYQDGMM